MIIIIVPVVVFFWGSHRKRYMRVVCWNESDPVVDEKLYISYFRVARLYGTGEFTKVVVTDLKSGRQVVLDASN